MDNKLKGYRHRVMSMPLVYQMIGMESGEVFIENNILKKVFLDKHADKYDLDVLKQLPKALSEPIAVFKNYHSMTDSVIPNSVVAIVELKSKNGKLTNVPIGFNKKANGSFIISIFLRENEEWYKNQLKHNRLLYVDRTKKDVIPMGGQSGPYALEITSFINDSILNENDLRKLKEVNPEFYQTAFHGSPYLFDRFSISDDGVYAHGWGVYFAKDKAKTEKYINKKARNTNEPSYYYGNDAVDDNTKWVIESYLGRAFNEAIVNGEKGITGSIESAITLARAEAKKQDRCIEKSDIVKNALKNLNIYDESKTGREIYRDLEAELGSAKAASLELHKQGVNGIHYFNNYDGEAFVVFDTNAIKMLAKHSAESGRFAQTAQSIRGLTTLLA